MNKHGGRRTGAGRKPLPPGERMVRVLVSLTSAQAAELRRRAKRNRTTVAAEVRAALPF